MKVRWMKREKSANQIPAPKQEYLTPVSPQNMRNPETEAG